jgi:hypothetical protein
MIKGWLKGGVSELTIGWLLPPFSEARAQVVIFATASACGLVNSSNLAYWTELTGLRTGKANGVR